MGQHLTKRDVEKIEKEIEMRRVELRPKLTKAVAEAANSRIRYLERVLRTAEIVEDTAEDEVGVDKEVRVYLPDDDEEDTYTLVTPIRADSLNNIVSIDSPIGKALLGHHVGDTVTVQANARYTYQLKILEIRDSSKADGLDINAF